jgi:hypothetical protein
MKSCPLRRAMPRLTMSLLIAILAAVFLVGATVAIHYEVLRWTSMLIPHISLRPRARILVVIFAVFLGHVIEVMLYAFAYFLMHENYGLGYIGGDFAATAVDFFYFSITTFTTLGIGDVQPFGNLRIVVGMQSLNGLGLIGWSASFTYLVMEKSWDDHRGVTRKGGKSEAAPRKVEVDE